MERNGGEHRIGQAVPGRNEAQEVQEPDGNRIDDDEGMEEDLSPAGSRRPTQELSRKISLPVLPTPSVDVSFSVDSILDAIKDEDSSDFPDFNLTQKQEHRMSRVLKLREENEKLEADLKALRERIAAAEERSREASGSEPRAGN